MTVTFFSTNSIGAGPRYTFTASGDALVVLPGVTIGASSGRAFLAPFTDVDVTVLGTMVSAEVCVLHSNSSFTLGVNATFMSFDPVSVNAGLFVLGNDNLAQIDGLFSALGSIGIITAGGNNRVVVTGSISAASGVFLGRFGSLNDILVNSGIITANSYDDVNQNTRFNNAVFAEGANTTITNLEGGVITATSSDGDGVRIDVGGDGSVVTNHGTIISVNSAGVDFAGATSAKLINTGMIQGLANSFNGAGGGAYTVLNSGHMIGDVLMGLGNDVFDGRGGRIDGLWSGGNGSDRYNGSGASLIAGPINGGNGNDTLLGGDGAETINGDANLDTLRGGGGDDELYGGLNSDLLAGDIGDDMLFGGDDYDDMSGGVGNDVLYGGEGALTARGGDGDDEMYVDGTATATFVSGLGGAGNDFILGGLIRDNIFGGSGDDEIFSDLGDDFLVGGSGDDRLNGVGGEDTLFGGSGDDSLSDSLGNDQLFGGIGDDDLSGGENNDLLDAGAGADSLDGGIGQDTLLGGSGDDVILGGNDLDTIDGGTGADVINGGGSADRINGGTGADSLTGETGNDTMNAGAGDDTLTGGSLADVQTGGTGADVFVLTALVDTGVNVGLRDQITDFLSGEDRFDLGLMDGNTILAGNQSFAFIGAAAFTNVAGQLRYVASTGLMAGDVNGDGTADFMVEFQNFVALAATDLLL